MQIPVGILLDRFGSRRLLTIATVTCAIRCLVFATATTFYNASLGRILLGIGSASAAIGCLNIAARLFPSRRFGLLTGMMLIIGMLSAIFGQAPLALMVERIGWRNTILTFALMGMLLDSFLLAWHPVFRLSVKSTQQNIAELHWDLPI